MNGPEVHSALPPCLPSAFMMKIQLAALSLCLSVVSAIVCPPNYCNSVDCSTITNEPCAENALLVPRSSFCGCCSTCITQLNKGDHCLNLLGVPATAVCRDPLRCIDGTCKETH
ncbi:fungal protease inhibitor-1-like [Periplaneta americana]|uniref:fungal protease inhibitor-1-like n=1 Tax=Periplaneta americana TaxID=6978 RepID=UPI0037E93831